MVTVETHLLGLNSKMTGMMISTVDRHVHAVGLGSIFAQGVYVWQFFGRETGQNFSLDSAAPVHGCVREVELWYTGVISRQRQHCFSCPS